MVTTLPVNAGDARDMGSIPGCEDALEYEMATHSSILAWIISWMQSPSAMILGPRKRKSVAASTFSPSIYHEVMGLKYF